MTNDNTKTVFWFGAGISIDSGLPDGASLTKKWLAHHLPSGEDAVLLDYYTRTAEITGKTLPRLEKTIEDALWSMGPDCLKNLAFFKHCAPNWVHCLIANELLEHQGWAITTNFDEAVEHAANWRIPVWTPKSEQLPAWGLLKLHGSISEELSSLGHCISNLERGLSNDIKAKLLALLDDPECLFVFIGYSGSDHFDITPLFLERMTQDAPFKAQAVLLHWTADYESASRLTPEELDELAPRFFNAFSEDQRIIYAGPTQYTLPRVLSCQPTAATTVPNHGKLWSDGWSERFTPTEEQRHLYAAKLYASMGKYLGKFNIIFNANFWKNVFQSAPKSAKRVICPDWQPVIFEFSPDNLNEIKFR